MESPVERMYEPMAKIRSGRRYMQAIHNLKARGAVQQCWRQAHPDCPRTLYADAPRFHPQSITLGHIIAYEDRPDLFWDPDNHAAECMKCNYSDGARRTNEKTARRLGKPVAARLRAAYEDPAWYEPWQVGPSLAFDPSVTRDGCPICGEALDNGRTYCTPTCKVEAAARRTRERYRAKVGLPLNPDQPTIPRGRTLELS